MSIFSPSFQKKMSELSPQELLNRICIVIVSIESLYEEMSQIDLSSLEQDKFLNWYDEAMDFLREQRDILQLELSFF